jgi:hypothetical protein
LSAYLLCDWIVCTHVGFSPVEHPKIRNFCSLLNSRVEDLLPTHHTVHNWINEVYSKQQDLLVVRMKASPFRINWGFDLRTSSNNKPILGIVALWLESIGQSGTLSTSTDVDDRCAPTRERSAYAPCPQGRGRSGCRHGFFLHLLMPTGLECDMSAVRNEVCKYSGDQNECWRLH